jgi:hypothetical protein
MAIGSVVPFLGAGANLCGRPKNVRFVAGKGDVLPSGSELARHLATRFEYPKYNPKRDAPDLARVAQFVEVQRGQQRLYQELHRIFSATSKPSALHRLLARLPSLLREKNAYTPYLLIVTTNYDDALETAFSEAGEEFHLVWYAAQGVDRRGKFVHQPPGESPRVIGVPNEGSSLSPDVLGSNIILKIHGDVDRTELRNIDRDSYVITEDHYIEYLLRNSVPAGIIPVGLLEKMKSSSFLFLGYSLRDWNLRVILYRIWQEEQIPFQSWAIQKSPEEFEQLFWAPRNVRVYDADLGDYVAELENAAEHYRPL